MFPLLSSTLADCKLQGTPAVNGDGWLPCNFAGVTTQHAALCCRKENAMSEPYTLEDFDRDIKLPLTTVGLYGKYFVLADGAALSYEAAKEEYRLIKEAIVERAGGELHGDVQWLVVGCEANMEDDTLVCCHTNDKIPPSYGGRK